MSELSFTLEEELSPDMFSDGESSMNTSNLLDMNESQPTEPEPMDGELEWKGVSMDEIYKGLGPYGCQQHPPISPSARHTVLISLPITNRGPPKPYPNQQRDKWCQGYVRMPHSAHSLYPVNHENGSNGFRQRWEVIQEALLQSFVSSSQLEAAILSYNHKYAQRWNFSALHHFFSQVVNEDEKAYFFEGLLPKIVHLALQLPILVTGAIPLLKRHTSTSISLSQLQVGSLLANAFLCTFPRRNSTNPQSEYAMYPHINFNRLFSSYREARLDRTEAVMEKLKCIFHYFRRITSKAPEGIITIQRRYIPKEDCPRWDRQDLQLPPFHITSKGTIESEGDGLLQVDFANKYVGGGVLGWGCVQEEIRFVICPELMVAMLVTEALDDTEALVVSGVERYSNYDGYSDQFKWSGDFVDETPRDNSGRRCTSIVAIDALKFGKTQTQFSAGNIIRELNKAYVGFSSSEIHGDSLSAVATGNWGCGAFRGNPQLKVLLQLMAAAVAGRSVVYFTFGDTDLRDKVAAMYSYLLERNIDVAQLYIMLHQYQGETLKTHSDFYSFLYKRSKIKSLPMFFNKPTKSPLNFRESIPQRSEVPSKSRDPEERVDRLINFTSKAKQKNDNEIKLIENWLDEDFSDFEDLKTEKLCSTIGKDSSFQPSSSTSNKISNRVKKKNLWSFDEPENKDFQLKPPNKSANIENPPSGEKKPSQETKETNKPRLSGLALLSTRQNSDVEETMKAGTKLSETTRDTNNGVNKKESSLTIKKSAQRKISDFLISNR